jgi:hypothetical protein
VAYDMAIGSDMIRAEIVDAEEFREMVRLFSVGPVPLTLINYRTKIIGAAPESYVLEKVLTAPEP